MFGRFAFFRPRGLALAGMLALAACASPGPQAPLRPLASAKPVDIVPPQAPKTTGVQTAAALLRGRLAAQFGGEYSWPPAKRYLNGILARLAAASDKPSQVYRVTLLDSPIVNAFALPSGDLYATRGLLALANDSSEVAAVMAHEIAHVTSRHAAKREELKRDDDLFQRVASRFEGPKKAAEVEARSRLSFASFSRQQEFQADRIGVRTIAKAGFDPYGAARFLKALERSAALKASLLGQKAGDEQPDLLSTHPTTPERIDRAVQVARQFGAPGIGSRGRSAYLAAIDGITFGDDPDDGLVAGRTFVHPKLRFAFTAPPGFVLDNYAQAVLGVGGSGADMLRLDKVRIPPGDTLKAYLTSGWMSGVRPASLQSIEVNGLPAAIAKATSGGWSFRFAAIRVGTDVYRLIFATRSASMDQDPRFLASIESFRQLSAEEAANVHPLRLKVVQAAQGDSVESLAERMAIAQKPLDDFLLLNGLKHGARLKPGESYKIVTH
ncbi:MAG TPA: M48 family metalloprotease [Beijerinckiaceae bacterium]|nr:M48 family metalloprotease [Beijerinckiaceae bacterium]